MKTGPYGPGSSLVLGLVDPLESNEQANQLTPSCLGHAKTFILQSLPSRSLVTMHVVG